MRIKSILIKQFKRFTDLTIQNIPETAKLVVLVGPNGSGKSSVFEAFNQWYRLNGWGWGINDQLYCIKRSLQKSQKTSNEINESNIRIDIQFYDLNKSISQDEIHGKFYFRGAYRNEPDFNVTQLTNVKDLLNRPLDNLMKTDTKVSDDYKRIISKTIASVYSTSNDNISVKDLREKILGKIQKSINNIFPDLELLNIGDPLEDGAFYFKKGDISKYHYKNLSAGEKAAFDLLLDLIVNQEYHPNSIFCIDEPECHLHTSLQEKVLEELYNNIPGNSQLWIATHSIGMLKKARELNNQYPDTVVFLDFGEKDFDIPIIMEPTEINKPIWDKFLELALYDFAGLIAPKIIVFCEGNPNSNRNKNFDQEVYSKIFQNEHPDVYFISIGSCTEIEDENNLSIRIIKEIFKETKIVRLVDRDDRSEDDIKECKAKGINVLKRRNIESYLLDDEMLKKLCESKNMINQIEQCLDAKQNAIDESVGRGNPKDDMKSASGKIYTDLKRILQLTQCGNNTHPFLRDIMAPLLTKDMELYTELEQCIFD